jgi:hypothetical protein
MAFNLKHIKPLVTFKKGREYQIIRRPENLKTKLKHAPYCFDILILVLNKTEKTIKSIACLERPPPTNVFSTSFQCKNKSIDLIGLLTSPIIEKPTKQFYRIFSSKELLF